MAGKTTGEHVRNFVAVAQFDSDDDLIALIEDWSMTETVLFIRFVRGVTRRLEQEMGGERFAEYVSRMRELSFAMVDEIEF